MRDAPLDSIEDTPMAERTFTAVYTQDEGWWVRFIEEVHGA